MKPCANPRTKVAPVYTVSFDFVRVQEFSADASVGVDTVPPASSVNSIKPYWQESVPFMVSATASDVLSGVASVELYYRSSIDNVNWSEWKSFGVDGTAPYEWSFTAPDSYAFYEFYSVATDVAGNAEEVPEVADAQCGVVIPAIIDIDPNTLNLKSRGRWITAYIELPSGYDLSNIRVSTIALEGTVQAELHPTEVGDHDRDGIPDLMVKFDRLAVQALLEPGETELTITGKWYAVLFKGSDAIRVIELGEGRQESKPEPPSSQPSEHPSNKREIPPGQSGEHPGRGQGLPETLREQSGQPPGQNNRGDGIQSKGQGSPSGNGGNGQSQRDVNEGQGRRGQ